MSIASHSVVPSSAAPGIRFNDYLFSEPVAIAAWAPPKYAGILAILVHDPNWAPKAYQPVHFGEFGNNTPLAVMLQDYGRFLAAAKGRTLCVTVLPMPFSTTAQRRELRNELVAAYNPECQTEGSAVPQDELAAKLSDLEKKYREQTAHMTFLLANSAPPPETPRRRIGFMPNTETAAA